MIYRVPFLAGVRGAGDIIVQEVIISSKKTRCWRTYVWSIIWKLLENPISFSVARGMGARDDYETVKLV